MIDKVSRLAGYGLAFLRDHRGLVEVLALGSILRLAVALSRDAAVYQDSLVYIGLSDDAPFSFSPYRPNGYPVLIRLIFLTGRDLDVVVAIQHLAGLGVGVLAYFMMLRLGTRKWIATLTVGILLVDAYTVALGQSILTESLWSLVMLGSAYLLLATRGRPVHLAASGALLAFACLMRVVGIFAVPVWLIYVFRMRVPWRVYAAAAAALLVPILAYGAFHAAHGKGFGLTHADGWYLYSKLAPTLNCRGASIPDETRPLCAGARGRPQDSYLYDRNSPAQELFFGTTGGVDVEQRVTPENNSALRSFAFAVIRAHPFEYTRIVVDNFFSYFAPAQRPPELSLYGQPGSLMRSYEQWFDMPWWLVTGATIAALVSMFRIRPGSSVREISFLVATATAVLLASAATASFNIRYLVPLYPLLLCAGAMGLEDLFARKAAPEGEGETETETDTETESVASFP